MAPRLSKPHGDDEPVLYWLFLVVGVVPVVIAIVRHGVWSWEPSLGLLMALFGAGGLLAELTGHRERRSAGRRQQHTRVITATRTTTAPRSRAPEDATRLSKLH